MSTVEKAVETAARAHANQVDKAGAPYVCHPLRLMLAVNTPFEKMVAALPDVIEDTALPLIGLPYEGFPPEVLDVVEVLTKRKGESRLEVAYRTARNPVAIVVKIAEVTDNMDLGQYPICLKMTSLG